MQTCGYCGKSSDEHFTYCTGCGATLVSGNAHTTRSFAEIARWRPTSPFGVAVAASAGAFLISTGVYFAVGRVNLDVLRLSHREEIDLLFFTPVVMFSRYVSPLLGIAAVCFIWFAAYRRCEARLHAFLSAVTASLATALFLFGPRFVPELFTLLWLPVTLIGIGTGISLGYYFGAALQLAIGAWLLGWFSRRNSENNLVRPDENREL
jgi:hypothetical protein